MEFRSCDVLRAILFVLFLVISCQIQDVKTTEANSDLVRLKTMLGLIGDKNPIDRNSRPVKQYNDTMLVSIFLIILHVHSLDELTGTLKINGWAQMLWKDANIHWTPEDYGGINYIHIPNNVIWQPDLTLYNIDEALEMTHYGDAMLFVSHDGTVVWVPPFSLKTVCPIDHKDFPFDEHICVAKLGSWTYPVALMNISILYEKHPESRLIREYFVENPLWKFISVQSSVKKLSFDCCPESQFPLLEVKVHLVRRSPYHKFLFLVPCLMSIMLTLAVFWLPPSGSEKITLGCVVVLMQTLLLVFMGYSIPPGGRNIPKIVLFCGNSLVMTCVSLIISIVVIRLSRTSPYMPLSSRTKQILSSPLRKFLILPPNLRELDGSSLSYDQASEEFVEMDSDNAERQVGSAASRLPAVRRHPSRILAATSYDWLTLATAVDQICFFIYTLIFAFLLINSFI